MLINDIVITSLYIAEENDQKLQNSLGNHIVKYSLLELIIGACIQIVFLILLWPMSKMFKKAIHMQKLEDWFKNERLPKNSIKIFLFCYVMRALLKIVHGGWAVNQYIKLVNNSQTSSDVIEHYSTNELFLSADEAINVFTILMIIVFFLLLSRNRRRVRDNFKQFNV